MVSQSSQFYLSDCALHWHGMSISWAVLPIVHMLRRRVYHSLWWSEKTQSNLKSKCKVMINVQLGFVESETSTSSLRFLMYAECTMQAPTFCIQVSHVPAKLVGNECGPRGKGSEEFTIQLERVDWCCDYLVHSSSSLSTTAKSLDLSNAQSIIIIKSDILTFKMTRTRKIFKDGLSVERELDTLAITPWLGSQYLL